MKNILFMVIMPLVLFAQEYTITTDPIQSYTIDRFTDEIYYKQYYFNQQDVYKTNFDGSYHIKTDFRSAPIFAHNSHKGIILEWTSNNEADYFIYDFETNEKKFLFKTGVSYGLYFSWDDSLLFNNASSGNEYYSFKDSILYSITTYIKKVKLEISQSGNGGYAWHKDNDRIIYLDNSIITYSLVNKQFDTLVSPKGYDNIFSFAYNPGYNTLDYSYTTSSYDTNYIYSLNLANSSINILFKSYNKSGCGFGIPGDCSSGLISKMTWNKEGNLLSFTSEPYIDPHVENFYVYNRVIDTTFQYARDNYGFTYQLKWLDENRVAYENATLSHKLMAFNYDKPLAIEKEKDETYTLSLYSYPNPFNSETRIEYSLQTNSNVKISIYNILGQKVRTLLNEKKGKGTYNIKWNGKDSNNNNIATGIYIINLTAKKNNGIIKNKYLKIINLK